MSYLGMRFWQKLASQSLMGITLTGFITISAQAAATDTDGDGLSDELETSIGMDPNSASDFYEDDDGDNILNGDEALDGTGINEADDFISPLSAEFGTQGFQYLAIGNNGLGNETELYELTTGPDDTIYLGGYTEDPMDTGFFGRLNLDGSLDTDFADNGYFFLSDNGFTGPGLVQEVLFDESDQLYASATYCTHQISCLFSLTDHGQIDTVNFAASTTPGVASIDGVNAGDPMLPAFLSDGSLMVYSEISQYNGNTVFYRLNSDGTVDTNFNGATGLHEIDVYTGAGQELAISLLKNADDTVIGLERISYDAYLIKLNSDGTLVNGFGTDGVSRVTADDGYKVVEAILLDDERIAVLGTSGDDGISLQIFNADGSLDTDFGDDGHFLLEAVSDNDYDPLMVHQQADGDFIIAAAQVVEQQHAAVVIKLTADGEFQTNFGSDGIQRRLMPEKHGLKLATVIANHDVVFAGTYINSSDDVDESQVFLTAISNSSDIDGDGVEDYADSDPHNAPADPIETVTNVFGSSDWPLLALLLMPLFGRGLSHRSSKR